MDDQDQTLILETLDRYCRSAREPLALVNQSGQLHGFNEAMRKRLGDHESSAKLLEQFCRSGVVDMAAFKVASDHLALVKLSLGAIGLITLLERNDDGRIKRLQQKLELAEKQSITDRLTGAWNRQQFDHVVRREMMRAQRYSQPLCLAIIDIDHFKPINDQHGHALGDRILKELVALLQSRIRIVDSLFRWGGEEFAVLLPHSAINGARLAAERLRAATAGHDFPRIGQLTVSIGVAELSSGESAAEWFERADSALYQAKQEGRNRVVCSTQSPALADPCPDQDAVVFLPWKASYECGHALIDQQHQQLFVLGNRLIAASLDTSTSREDFLACVDDLIAHVGQHFSDEEQVLAEVDYEDLKAHRHAHSALIEKASLLRSKASQGTATSGEVIDFLVNSVVKNHMLTADKAFFEHLSPEREFSSEV